MALMLIHTEDINTMNDQEESDELASTVTRPEPSRWFSPDPNSTMKLFSLCAAVAAACLLLDAGVVGLMMTTCGPHRNGLPNVHRLACETGVIKVTSSFFGRRDTRTCATGRESESKVTDCSLDSALALVSKTCNGKKVCEVNENSFERDPCEGVFKYIVSEYTCIPAIHLIACDQNMAHLECHSVFVCSFGPRIKVLSADFGRSDSTICTLGREASELQNTQCDGQQNRAVRINKANLGYGCDGVSQYLDLLYTCQGPGASAN
ncbi:hypothetical protein WMY93_006856 [Mugilogobius chulae]|uniref:SUEL-type lectin domain-containing protein n=1 Tax=Mugilogobius chulae TaxID=88201 RepID=A0AAW0PXE4_9GOBI